MRPSPHPLPPPRVLGTWAVPDGDPGVARTIGAMRALAHGASGDADFRSFARIIAGPSDRAVLRIERIRAFVADKVRFRFDPEGVELVTAPARLLAEIAFGGWTEGDCDDSATLAAALGLAVGLRARFVTVALARGAPYTHVFAELRGPVGWYELDTLREVQGIPPGYQAPRSRRWPVP